jgi:hypothetical protein
MSHISANDEYRSQVGAGATNRPENIVIRYVSFVYLHVLPRRKSSRRFQFSFTDISLVYRSAVAQIFPRSQSMRESNTSPTHILYSLLKLLRYQKMTSSHQNYFKNYFTSFHNFCRK